MAEYKGILNTVPQKEINKTSFYIFQGDSYAIPDAHGFNSWAQNTVEYLGLTSSDYLILDDDSGGFADEGVNGTFQEQLEDNVVTGHTVTHVVVCAGANDRNKPQADVEVAIVSYIAKAKELYPNANVYISCIGWSETGNYAHEIYNVSYQSFKKCAIQNGAIWLESPCYALLFNSDFIDYLHPSEVGAKKIGLSLANELRGRDSIVSHEISMTTQAATGITFDNALTLYGYQRGSMCGIKASTTNERISLTCSLNLNSGAWTKICDTSDGFTNGAYGIQFATVIWVRDSSSKDVIMPATIRFMAKQMYLKPSSGVNNVRLILMSAFTATAPSRTGVD